MKPLKAVGDFIAYSNLFIALGAVCLVLTNQLTVGESVHFNPAVFFVFFSTLFTYSALKFRGSSSSTNVNYRNWAQENGRLQMIVLFLSLMGTLHFFILLNNHAKLIVAALALITALYGFVDIPFVKPARKLRQFGLLKTLFVGFVWSVTTVVVPFAPDFPEGSVFASLVVKRFLFIAALTMVFEIKDFEDDLKQGLKTLPMVLGINGTKLLAIGALAFIIALNIWQYAQGLILFSCMMAINASLLVSILCIVPVKRETPDKWYYVVLDGMMLLQFIFVYLTIYL